MKLEKLPKWYLLKLTEVMNNSYDITENNCWEWKKSRDKAGYGKVSIKHAKSGVHLQTSAHRVYYQLLNGFIDRSLVIDHLCENPPCINPDHLEAITQRENNARGTGLTANNLRKTKCDNGHDYTKENTGIHEKTGWRYCRICSRRSTNISLQKRTQRYNEQGLNSKGKPFKSELDRKRSLEWSKRRLQI